MNISNCSYRLIGRFVNRFFGCLLLGVGGLLANAQVNADVQGSMVANGDSIELPYVYIWAEKEGFYDSNDRTWKVLFVGKELKPRELGDTIWDSAWLEVGITETSEFSEQKKLQVYTQSIKFDPDSGGNISGGNYPQIEISGLDTGDISGRIWHAEEQVVFDDKFQYDFQFNTILSDPNAPIGDLLPEGGGEPGKAYQAWSAAVHSGDVEQLKAIVPEEMAAQLSAVTPEEAAEEIGFMKEMTPTDIRVLSGSTDGEIALMQIEGSMAGETINAEVTMTKMGSFWLPTNSSM